MNGSSVILCSRINAFKSPIFNHRTTLGSIHLLRKFSAVSNTFRKGPLTLSDIANHNSKLSQALELFESNRIPESLNIALAEYRNEVEERNPEQSFVSSRLEDESARPAFSFLSQLLASLGPKHPETVKALSVMRATVGEEATPFKPRVIQKQHGGYPVRLNNGKWTWQGPHWSRHNNRTWKTGYSSDFTYGSGK